MRWLIRITGDAVLLEALDQVEHLADLPDASAAVGSSMITSLASDAVSRAIATAWRWPPDIRSTFWSTGLDVDLSRSRCSAASHAAGA